MWTAVLAIAAILVIVGAVVWLCWNYSDYIITAWNWMAEAYNVLISTVPGWALVAFSAALLLAFLGILVRVF